MHPMESHDPKEREESRPYFLRPPKFNLSLGWSEAKVAGCPRTGDAWEGAGGGGRNTSHVGDRPASARRLLIRTGRIARSRELSPGVSPLSSVLAKCSWKLLEETILHSYITFSANSLSRPSLEVNPSQNSMTTEIVSPITTSM